MTLKQAVEDPQSPLRRFLDTRLPHTRIARTAWKQAVAATADVTPPAVITMASGVTRRYPYDEVGHAASLRLTLLFSADIPQPVLPPARHPVTRQPWASAEEAHSELLARVATAAGFAPLPDAEERRLVQLMYVAGLFDQFFRIGTYPGLPLLEVPPGVPLDVLIDTLVHPACVEDIVALTKVARGSLAQLVARGAPVVAGPTFVGSGDVGGADADLLVGSTLVEFKTRGNLELQQRHLHQLVAYVLLDYDDVYGIDDLAWYSARHGALVRLSLSDVLVALAGGPVEIATLRGELRQQIARTTSTGSARPR